MSHTIFEGELKFTTDLSVPELAHLNYLLNRPLTVEGRLILFDFELLEDFSGIIAEDTNTDDILAQANFIIQEMRPIAPNFGLRGQMLAQGDTPSDRWILAIGDYGFAYRKDIEIKGKKVACPQCHHEFLLNNDIGVS